MEKSAILTAAGQGRRFGGETGLRKQWLQLNGRPMLLYGIDALLQAGCRQLLLTHHPDDLELTKLLLSEYHLTERVRPVAGGSERQHSIWNALQQLPDEGLVAVHDGVRPLVRPEVIERLFELAATADGVIPGRPVVDTVKRVEEGQIVTTLDRSRLITVHTPQVFPTLLLKEAYRAAADSGFLGTDDASLVERLPGRNLVWLEDEQSALKITRPADLACAEKLIKESNCADWFRF